MSVEHPFENGRLIVWIDGVLVHEAKLQAPVSRKIVAFKVREGRAESCSTSNRARTRCGSR